MTENIRQHCRNTFIHLEKMKLELLKLREAFVTYRTANHSNIFENALVMAIEANLSKMLSGADATRHDISQVAIYKKWNSPETANPTCRVDDKRCQDCEE